MKLSSLINFLQKKNFDFELYNYKDGVEIKGVCADGRKFKYGDLFVAIKGLKYDSHRDVDRLAVDAPVVVVDAKFSPVNTNTVFLRVKDSRNALSLIAQWWFGDPSSKLKLIGITGTKGKTTTANILYQIMMLAGLRVGLISTVNAKIGNKIIQTGLHTTNPEPIELQQLLRSMVDKKIEYAIIEVSSHGIDQGRIYGLDFEVSAITNIAPEHLDYHKTFENYKNTKFKLLEQSKAVIANKDDESFLRISEIADIRNSRFITYSLKKPADYLIGKVETKKMTSFELLHNESQRKLTTNLLGRFNLYNLLAAMATAEYFKINFKSIKKTLSNLTQIEGRVEKIANNLGIDIYIDFAHTPDSVKNVLEELRSKTNRKLIVVLGSAGERDTGKRSKMGLIAANIADCIIFTAEDPRSEKVNEIIKSLKSDIPKILSRKIIKIPIRSEAIIYAIKRQAKKGDLVVIMGKGHEKSMNYQGIEHPWSDRSWIKIACDLDDKKTAVIMAAGKGTRLKSERPKVLHELAGRAMIAYSVENFRRAGFGSIYVVVGYKASEVIDNIGYGVNYAFQKSQLGTGHAAWQGIKKINADQNKDSEVVVVNGDDTGFYDPVTLIDILNFHKKKKSKITFTSTTLQDPTGNGRLIHDGHGNLLKIVEEKVATDDEKKIKQCNINMFVFNTKWFLNNIKKVKKGKVGEYYITDLVEIAISQNDPITTYQLKDSSQWFGVNTPEQLQEANKRMVDAIGKNFNE